MWTITGGTENKPVKVKHILNFGRCKRFQPYEAVISALKDSEHLEVSGAEGDEEIKRKKAYVPSNEAAQTRVARSVYVKGFGDETPTTQIDIEAFFAPYGPISAIRLRRTDEEYFKGSVFVEFPSEEAAKTFLALEPAPTYQGHELKIMSKRAYMEEKNQLIKDGKLEPQKQQKSKFWEGKELGGSKGGRGGRGGGNRQGDSDDWKKRRENDQKNGHGGRGGRGGRGRGGRGGRGRGGRGGRDDRNGRDRRQEAPTQVNTNKYASRFSCLRQLYTNSSCSVQRPRVNHTEASTAEAKENGKRAREDDGAAQPPAKKVDTKTEAAPAGRSD
jgi:lupus La protein